MALNATGENLLWYDAEDTMMPIGAGSDYPVYVDQTTTFWVASESVNDGTTATGAKDERDLDNGQFHQNNGFWLVFDAYQNMTLESVKAYASGLGSRQVTLVDASGATLQSSTVNMEDGENTVDLNFFVPAGEGYGLRVSSDNPQLWRDGIGSNPDYPYALGDFGAITGTSVNGANSQNYYYFFYDWTVSVDAVGCASERVPADGHRDQPVQRGPDRRPEQHRRLSEPHGRRPDARPRPRRQRPRPALSPSWTSRAAPSSPPTGAPRPQASASSTSPHWHPATTPSASPTAPANGASPSSATNATTTTTLPTEKPGPTARLFYCLQRSQLKATANEEAGHHLKTPGVSMWKCRSSRRPWLW